jgi:two-component system LytT family response regulator
LIADDEPAARRGVRQLLAAFPEFAVAGECRNGAEVLAALDTSTPDVIFLDIQMPGIDGFEVIKRRTVERMPAVVFLTAFDQFAIRAFETEALDYLVKPVTEARFAATMKRLIMRLESASISPRSETIVVTTTRGATVLHLNEIDWIEAAGNYSQLWVGTRSYFLRESLQLLEERVQQSGFISAHRRWFDSTRCESSDAIAPARCSRYSQAVFVFPSRGGERRRSPRPSANSDDYGPSEEAARRETERV